jgi:hypothetical protein
MKMPLALALFVTLTAPGTARVGETMAELKLRYGQPIDVEGEPESPTSRWTFQERNYVIVVTLRKNRSESEEFTRRDHRDFTLAEVRELLEESAAPGAGWSQVSGKSWRQGDRVATWFERTLLVQSE